MATRRFGRGSLRPVMIGDQPAWEIDYRDATGKRCRRTAGRTKPEAQAILVKLIRDRDLELAGMGIERGLSMTVAELADQYVANLRSRKKASAAKKARHALARLDRELGLRTVREITIPAVDVWRARRIEQGAAHGSVNSQLGVLKAALAFAFRAGQLAVHPLRGMPNLPAGRDHQKRPRRALADWELSKLFDAAAVLDAQPPSGFSAGVRPIPRRPFLIALVLTGARYGELSRVTWGDVDFEAGLIRLRSETTKNRHARALPIAAELEDALRLLLADYRARGLRVTMTSPVFLNSHGRTMSPDTRSFLRWLRRALDRAGIDRTDGLGQVVDGHAMRHTFCTRLMRANVSIATAQRLTGHRSPDILLRVYAHVRDDEARKAVESLPALGVGGRMETTQDGAERARPSAAGS